MSTDDREVGWRIGSVLKADPAKALDQVTKLREAHGGYFPHGALVKDSEDPSKPLHNDFEWRDEVAADKYRRRQEKYILKAFVFVEQKPGAVDSKPVQVPIFTASRVGGAHTKGERVYVTVESLLETPEGRAELLDKAYRELRAFTKKYQMLEELTGVHTAITELLDAD